jgi:hypothetical protein
MLFISVPLRDSLSVRYGPVPPIVLDGGLERNSGAGPGNPINQDPPNSWHQLVRLPGPTLLIAAEFRGNGYRMRLMVGRPFLETCLIGARTLVTRPVLES